MILDALGSVLAEAVGILMSPLPIVAVILMLFTARAKTNSFLFLLGWIVGLAVVGAIVLIVADGADVSTDASASDGSGGGGAAPGTARRPHHRSGWRRSTASARSARSASASCCRP